MVDRAEDKSGPVWATKNDSRITPVGSILRKLRLDEIPQFLNVLAGDMSLVGPRPERPTFVRKLSHEIDSYDDRLEAKPGITGLAQIKGSYDTSPGTVARKLRLDLEYIERWSMWLDLKILLKTVWVVLTGKGAH
ncbi:MAG: sugar transferase, partial [Candidatus Zixiibacteriota bacterium]